MKKSKLYLETSVWNFYFADDAPEKRDVTIIFFEQLTKSLKKIYISELVFDEIKLAPKPKRNQMLNLIEQYPYESLDLTSEVVSLAQTYISDLALPAKSYDDALHAAAATVHQINILLSWNLKHLVNENRKQKINTVNKNEGYKTINFFTPMEYQTNEI